MVILITSIAVLLNLYCFYTVILRMARIKSLPNDIMPSSTKKTYLDMLERYLGLFVISFVISILFVSFRFYGVEFLTPVISIIISSNVLYKILDEIDEFDLNKKDSDIVKDFLEKTRKDARNKGKDNKIKAEVIDLDKIRETEASRKLEEIERMKRDNQSKADSNEEE